jgi:hypothetical protein
LPTTPDCHGNKTTLLWQQQKFALMEIKLGYDGNNTRLPWQLHQVSMATAPVYL